MSAKTRCSIVTTSQSIALRASRPLVARPVHFLELGGRTTTRPSGVRIIGQTIARRRRSNDLPRVYTARLVDRDGVRVLNTEEDAILIDIANVAPIGCLAKERI